MRLLAGAAGQVGEPLGGVEAGVPALEGDGHAARLGAVLLAGAVDVDGQLGVVAGEGSHGLLLGSGPTVLGRWRRTVGVEPGCKVKPLTLHPGARSTVDGCGSPSSPRSAGVPTSTVRYYERVGLLALPARTSSGYRDYGDDAAARLLFITRARRMGLSCEQITALIPVWAGTNCGAAHERVGRLIEEKQAEIAERIAELEQFAAQLDDGARRARGAAAAAGLPGRPHLLRPAVRGRAGRHRARPMTRAGCRHLLTHVRQCLGHQ